ncbi:unnamed protein product [Urochloa humidicola]
MPTITHYVLDPFLETGSPAQVHKAAPKPPPPPPDPTTPVPVVPVRTQTSPASLYATPESTTLPDSPSSFPGTWSPYIINHKRRGASLAKTLSQGDAASEGSLLKLPVTLPGLSKSCEPIEVQEPEFAFQQANNGQAEGDSGVEEPFNGQDGVLQKGKGSVKAENEQDQHEFEFQRGSLEAIDSMSVASNSETDEIGAHDRWWKPSSPLGTSVGTPGAEFYDAFEEISSDGGTRSSRAMDDDLREMRLSLLMEIERRKQAEEALENWQTEWKKLSHHLSRVALSLPSPSIAENTDDSSMDPGAELCQQITVSQLVAAAIARGLARAEVESEMETVIAAKNFEIARLSDRVQYYEAANREMSQRNQEAIEMSRQQRKERKKRQKWFWGSVGLAVTLGATAIAWSYLPSSQPQASADSNSTSSE